MAKANRPRPQNPEKVSQALECYKQLSEHDKGLFLQKAGVFFLQFRWRPISPTPELRPVVNQLSRLALLINTLMRRVSVRRLGVEKLAVISEQRIRENFVQPAVELTQNQCREIEHVLDGNETSPANYEETEDNQVTQSPTDNGWREAKAPSQESTTDHGPLG